MNDVVRIELLSHSIDKLINLRQDLKDEDLIVLGDANELENAILNLGINARDAMDHGGNINISKSVGA